MVRLLFGIFATISLLWIPWMPTHKLVNRLFFFSFQLCFSSEISLFYFQFVVSELMFHPERPEHLFSCSTNGQLWHWDSSKLSHTTISQFAGESSGKSCSTFLKFHNLFLLLIYVCFPFQISLKILVVHGWVEM